MKWPTILTLERHAQSVYNELRVRKEQDPEYQEFACEFKKDSTSRRCQGMARLMLRKYALGVSDYETPLTSKGCDEQALPLGEVLHSQSAPTPDIIFCSPYLRTRQTLAFNRLGWSELAGVETVYDDRIREQEHGLSLLYNDWRIFHTFHPKQKALLKLVGPYWYQYPQGESVSNVRDRTRLFTDMLIRECAEMNVWIVTHHLTILSMRANFEHLTPEEFIALDEKQKPVNCGLTTYIGNPNKGKNGKLELESYNQNLWKRD